MADATPKTGSRTASAGLRSAAITEGLRTPKLAFRPDVLSRAKITPAVLGRLPNLAGLRPTIPALLPGLPGLRPAAPTWPAPSDGAPEPEIPPPAPHANPFEELPYRSPGDRILAADFNRLSQALEQLAESQRLSSALFGTRFAAARERLEGQGYAIRRVVSVFGTALGEIRNESAAERLVISVSLVALGAADVDVVLSERVEGRRFMPDLRGRSYPAAREAMRALLADAPLPPPPGPAPDLTGSTLATERNRY